MSQRNNKVISICIDPYLLQCLDNQARRLGLNRSSYIAEIVKLVETGQVKLLYNVVNGVYVA